MPTFLLLAPSLHHPWGDQPQSISDLLFFEYLGQHLCLLKASDALTVVVSDAVELLLAVPYFPLEAFVTFHPC